SIAATPLLRDRSMLPTNTGSQMVPGAILERGLTERPDNKIKPATPVLAEDPMFRDTAPINETLSFSRFTDSASRDATKEKPNSATSTSAPARSNSEQEKGKGRIGEASRKGEDSDSTIPELDSGSSGFGEEDDEDGTEEEEEGEGS
ncbi:MAG: hypothetical protein TREMPRED_005757, partial [Tremellales sp. Tagirdzhanova-0007]